MDIGRVLIPLYDNPFDSRLFEMAQQIVKGGHACLQVVYFRAAAGGASFAGLEDATDDLMSEQNTERAAETMVANIRQNLEAWAGLHGYSITDEHAAGMPFQLSFKELVDDPTEALTLLGRLSDLIICVKPSRDFGASQQIFDTAISATGRLTLVVPKDPPAEILRHVLIAWDGSLQISHVLAQAIRFLRLAGRISIFCYPDANCDQASVWQLLQYLACHGITARQIEVRRTKAIGETLTETATAENVSLIAMGAYGHSRTREFLLGGLTRHMLKHTTMPLLMTH
jgi:nucleotide-binding universal stress UspA family protein